MIVCVLITTVTLSTFNSSRIIIVDDMGARPSATWNQPAQAKGAGEPCNDQMHRAGPACREVLRFLNLVKHFPRGMVF